MFKLYLETLGDYLRRLGATLVVFIVGGVIADLLNIPLWVSGGVVVCLLLVVVYADTKEKITKKHPH